MALSKVQYNNFSFYSDNILVRKFNGPIQVEDIIDSWEFLLRNKILTTQHKGVINDIYSAELLMNMESFGKLISFLKKNPVLSKLKLAVICDSAEKMIFPLVGEMDNKDLRIKPFSTIEAGAKWILQA